MLHRWSHDFGSISWWFEKNVGNTWGICLLTRVHFNPAKTQLIQFGSTVKSPCSMSFIFCGQHLTMLDSGFTWGAVNEILTSRWSLRILLNMQILYFCRGLILRMVYWKLVYFSHTILVSIWWGLWRLSSRQIEVLEVSCNNILRRIWPLPFLSYTALVTDLEYVYFIVRLTHANVCESMWKP